MLISNVENEGNLVTLDSENNTPAYKYRLTEYRLTADFSGTVYVSVSRTDPESEHELTSYSFRVYRYGSALVDS